jgi:hypothetical protein
MTMKTTIASLFNRFTAWVCQVLDKTDPQSSTRLVLLVAWGSVLGVWIILSGIHQRLVDVPESVQTLLGMATGAKVAQHITNAVSQPPVDSAGKA